MVTTSAAGATARSISASASDMAISRSHRRYSQCDTPFATARSSRFFTGRTEYRFSGHRSSTYVVSGRRCSFAYTHAGKIISTGLVS